MTQLERVLTRLQTGEWLSSVEASRDMFIMRLGARIFDLRNGKHKGIHYEIEERRVPGKTYSEYRLKIAPPVLPPSRPEPKQTTQALFT